MMSPKFSSIGLLVGLHFHINFRAEETYRCVQMILPKGCAD